MKFKKSIIALGIVFLILTGVIAYAETGVTNQGIGKTTEEESLAKYDSYFLAQNENSYLSYEKLIESFEDKETSETVYPDYYGGSYIDDNGKLVIYVTGTDDVSQNIRQAIGMDDFLIKSL